MSIRVFSWNILAQRFGLEYLNREALLQVDAEDEFEAFTSEERKKYYEDPFFIKVTAYQRYKRIVAELPTDAIICLQEVDRYFLEVLKIDEFTVHIFEPHNPNAPEWKQWGNAIISYHEYLDEYVFDGHSFRFDDRAYPCLTINNEEGMGINITNVHLPGFDRSNPEPEKLAKNLKHLKEVLELGSSIIVGDFNMDFDKDPCKDLYGEHEEVIGSHCFGYRRLQSDMEIRNDLDHILVIDVESTKKAVKSFHFCGALSDHYPVTETFDEMF